MPRAKLSILIPCYNEARSIDNTLRAMASVAQRLRDNDIDVELVAVDDCSTDGTYERLQAWSNRDAFRLLTVRHPRNRGKGGAIQTGRTHCNGDIVVLQDADLELDPAEIPRVITPIVEGRADAVLGSRFLRSEERIVVNFWHRLGNKVLTYVSNAFTGLDITDMETGFKAFSKPAFEAMYLTKDRFGIEPEMVARLAQMRARVAEVPVSYRGRTYREGKKITWKDGVAAFAHIIAAHRSAHKQPRLVAADDGTSIEVSSTRGSAVITPRRSITESEPSPSASPRSASVKGAPLT